MRVEVDVWVLSHWVNMGQKCMGVSSVLQRRDSSSSDQRRGGTQKSANKSGNDSADGIELLSHNNLEE